MEKPLESSASSDRCHEERDHQQHGRQLEEDVVEGPENPKIGNNGTEEDGDFPETSPDTGCRIRRHDEILTRLEIRGGVRGVGFYPETADHTEVSPLSKSSAKIPVPSEE